jgi:hypothetical protein
LVLDCRLDGFGIDDFPLLLGADGQGIRHQVVNQAGIALREAVRCGKCRCVDDGCRGSGETDLVQDVSGNFFIAQPVVVIVDGDALAQGFMDGLATVGSDPNVVWAEKKFKRLDWQEQIIRDLFGIIKKNGYRQFNTAY